MLPPTGEGQRAPEKNASLSANMALEGVVTRDTSKVKVTQKGLMQRIQCWNTEVSVISGRAPPAARMPCLKITSSWGGLARGTLCLSTCSTPKSLLSPLSHSCMALLATSLGFWNSHSRNNATTSAALFTQVFNKCPFRDQVKPPKTCICVCSLRLWVWNCFVQISTIIHLSCGTRG